MGRSFAAGATALYHDSGGAGMTRPESVMASAMLDAGGTPLGISQFHEKIAAPIFEVFNHMSHFHGIHFMV